MTLNRATAAKRLAQWKSDPVRWCQDVLGFEPWARQAEILHALAANAAGGLPVAVRSGHKCGKSRAAAAAGLWFLFTRPKSRVVFTAPTGHQIQNVLWKEVRALATEAKLRGTPLCDDDQLFTVAHTGLRLPDGRDMFGLSTDRPEQFAGISAPNLLFVVDEASGIDEAIFEAVFGNMAGGASLLLISNPTKTAGTFFDAFHAKRPLWQSLHMASTETPNFMGRKVPGLATPEWVAWAKEQWGEYSPYFDVRVRGDFPTQSENAVIPLRLVEEAQTRGRALATQPDSTEPLYLGVDVARFGDDETVIFPRRGSRLYPCHAYRGLDGPAVAGKVLHHVRDLTRLGEVPVAAVDVIGYGASAYDALAAETRWVQATPVNVQERSEEPDAYPNLRSQLWFRLRDWLKGGGALPDDERLAAELVSATYTIDSKGRTVVDPKDRIKEVLKRSPDRADAAALAVYAGGSGSFSDPSLEALQRVLPKRRI